MSSKRNFANKRKCAVRSEAQNNLPIFNKLNKHGQVLVKREWIFKYYFGIKSLIADVY